MALVGVHSYSIYLWHGLVEEVGMGALRTVWSGPFWAEFLVYLVGSIAVGIVMAKLVELPVLHWRDRLIPARAKVSLAAAPPAEVGPTASGATASEATASVATALQPVASASAG